MGDRLGTLGALQYFSLQVFFLQVFTARSALAELRPTDWHSALQIFLRACTLARAIARVLELYKKDKVRKDRSLVSDKSLNKGLISEDRNARLLCFLQYPVLVQVVCMGFISGGKRF